MNESLLNGLMLLGMGMSVVLCFLVVLFFAMQMMTGVVGYLNKIFPEAAVEVKSSVKKAEMAIDEAVAVAIAAVRAKRS